MNRFRSRKKVHDGGDTDVPPVPSYSRTFKRGKKPVPEPKQPAVDIATALPPSADFRTSLLMPNLSARFSMLREQDDPTSKIGKANDDSVLFPKRASRLNFFQRNELTDIAEVDSIHGSIRPPFESTKTDSYGSLEGYGTDDGHMMSRARPGEGNTLFGGRQKIYRIPVGARRSSGDGNGDEDGDPAAKKGMGGRALYGDDVASSTFPSLWRQDAQESPEVSSEPPSVQPTRVPQRSDSPSGSYNQNRETISSTASIQMESRSSTAATSVASQKSVTGGPGNSVGSSQPTSVTASDSATTPLTERHPTKSRRLYGQGLDQHIYDQQSSAMHRLESLQRQRATGATSLPRNLSQPGSGTKLQERYQRSGASNISSAYRAASPPPSSSPSRLREFELGLTADGPSTVNRQPNAAYCRSPPLSPPMSPIADPKLVAALEPNDVGKATALGAFNKPQKQYDEQQYLERQIQLQQTPPLTRPFSPPALSIDQQTMHRPRGDSPVSPLSRSNSLETHQTGDPSIRVVSAIQHVGQGEHHPTESKESERGETFLSAATPSDLSPSPMSEIGPGNNSSHQTPSSYQHPSKWVFGNPRPEKPRDIDHPIHRQNHDYQSEEKSVDYSMESRVKHRPENISLDHGKPKISDADSPTLGPANEVTGLNGLVHTHLRNDSGQSSIYPEPSPRLVSNFPDDLPTSNHSFNHEAEPRSSETFFRKSTWENEGLHVKQPTTGEAGHPPVAIPPPLSVRARHILEQAVALQNHNSSKAHQLLGNENTDRAVGQGAPRGAPKVASIPTWQEQLKIHHTRGGSTETEKERQSFANELAERRRMVQDNLKSFVENESRSSSPMPGNRTLEHSPSKPGTSFGILRSKTSKGTLAARQDHPSKAMKMLGISISPGTSSGSLQSKQESLLEQEDAANHGSPDLRTPAHARPSMQDSRHHQHPIHSQRRTEQSNDRHQEYPPRHSPPASKSSREDRSNSDSSDRGFDGRHGRSITQGTHGREGNLSYHPSGAQARQHNNFPRPQADLDNAGAISSSAARSQSAMSGRFRSNSKVNTPGYAEHHENQPRYPSPPHNLDTSPSSTYSGHSTPSHEASPNVSSITTPIMMAPSYSATARLPSHRKRSINKHDISDPTFISSTSSVNTVNLPPGASLSNGMGHPYPGPPPGVPPPIPPLNPRRRRTQTLRQALGRLEKPETTVRPQPPTSQPESYEERSTFSADEGEPRARYRTRLRKTSSEGGNLSVKARQQMLLTPSPAMPPYIHSHSAGPSPATKNLPHPVPASVPASAVMF